MTPGRPQAKLCKKFFWPGLKIDLRACATKPDTVANLSQCLVHCLLYFDFAKTFLVRQRHEARTFTFVSFRVMSLCLRHRLL